MAEKWELYELEFIREVAGQISSRVIAEKLERTHGAIEAMARRLGISLATRPKAARWRDDEIKLLVSHSIPHVSKLTNRSTAAVRDKLYKLRGTSRRSEC